MALVSQEVDMNYPGLIRFDPPVPQVSLVHVYINTSSSSNNDESEDGGVATAMCVKDETAQECLVSCFSRLRPSRNGGGEVYMEFNMVSTNDIPYMSYEVHFELIM